VTARFAYDARLDPPAPVVPVRISGPVGDEAVMLPMLVDTGADCTLVPVPIVRQLRLPRIDVIGLTGVGGARQRATVHAATVELGGLRVLVRVVAFADDAILGRDILNQAVVTLDGPGLAMSIAGRARSRRRPRAPADKR
jgi:predicted aspartyl protease